MGLAVLLGAPPAQAGEAAVEMPVRVIDRPTSLPQWVPALTVSGTSMLGVDTSGSMALAGAVGLTDHVEVGALAPTLELPAAQGFSAPAAYIAYGWDPTATIAVRPSVDLGFPLVAERAAWVMTPAVAVSWTATNYFEIGAVPGWSFTPGEQMSELSLPVFAFGQLTKRVFAQLDVGPVVASGSGGMFDFEDTRIAAAASGGYVLGKTDEWLLDVALQGGWSRPLAAGQSGTNQWSVGMALTAYWVP